MQLLIRAAGVAGAGGSCIGINRPHPPGGGGILYPEVSEILSPVVSVFTIDNSVDSLARARAARVMVGLSVAAVRVVRVRRETNHLRLDTNLAKNFQEPFSDR